MAPNAPVRVLNVVGSMDRGGIETWLMHVLRHVDRRVLNIDFLVHTDRKCAYDEEIAAFGSRIIRCPLVYQPWRYIRALGRTLRDLGPYDVVHSHVHHFSGLVLQVAAHCGVPVRIAHSHSDTASEQDQAGAIRRLYLNRMKRGIRQHATIRLGASQKAAAALFNGGESPPQAWSVLHYGIDMQPFSGAPERNQTRRSLGIPPDAFVLGHVGNFYAVKNHDFLLDVFVDVLTRNPSAHLLLVGDGPLRAAIAAKAEALSCADRVVFAGMRQDVPQLLMGVIDVFVFPSRWEGLPLAGIEAQAAGLPSVISNVISTELDVVPQLIQRRGLDEPARAWGSACLEARLMAGTITQAKAFAAIQQSSFDIRRSVDHLERLYTAALQS